MQYDNIRKAYFIDRPNRFVAHVNLDGNVETVHVKNTGRCAELLTPGATVYIQDSENAGRKTRWDLIGVEKNDRLINMDSQIPNHVVREWLLKGNLISGITKIQPEYTYGNSRIDLYIEAGERKVLIEVKGVTLENNGVVKFPDAPSERAVKHIHELEKAQKEGYETYIFFVVQMKGVSYFTPNKKTQPEFADALIEAEENGVKIIAYDCLVTEDSIEIQDEVKVILENPQYYEMANPLVSWYRENKRDLPWRKEISAYRVWVSEIMLQQTRVEAVKPYFERFLKELPDVKSLAEVSEDKLLKLWEGLGYYNRVRNMQLAARQVMVDYKGVFPDTYEEIRKLRGIGNYTAGAISSFAYGIPKPAVDGNVLRVLSRLTGSHEDIMKQSVRNNMERTLEKIIPPESASDFNQGLIELGAIVCVPNGKPKCESCPLQKICVACEMGLTEEIPVKSKPKGRKIEKKTVLLFKDGEKIAITKRPKKGLLAGLYEFPNLESHLTAKAVTEYCKKIGLMPIHIKKLSAAKHIFSHVEWHMIGYEIKVDELEKTNKKDFLFITPEEIQKTYPIPSAFEKYMPEI